MHSIFQMVKKQYTTGVFQETSMLHAYAGQQIRVWHTDRHTDYVCKWHKNKIWDQHKISIVIFHNTKTKKNALLFAVSQIC